MKEFLLFKQRKPITVTILGAFLLALLALIVYEQRVPLSQTVVMLAGGILLLAYSVSYEIRKDFKHKKHLKLFGMTVLRSKLDYFEQERGVVLPTVSRKSNNWGPISAIGTKSTNSEYVIRLFKGNRYFTLYRSNSFELIVDLGKQLSEVLEVPIDIKK